MNYRSKTLRPGIYYDMLKTGHTRIWTHYVDLESKKQKTITEIVEPGGDILRAAERVVMQRDSEKGRQIEARTKRIEERERLIAQAIVEQEEIAKRARYKARMERIEILAGMARKDVEQVRNTYGMRGTVRSVFDYVNVYGDVAQVNFVG